MTGSIRGVDRDMDDVVVRRGQPTLEDVAAAAGVSRSTASRAINGEAKVSPQARAAVADAVLALGFTPNQAARTLVTQRTNAVALVIPEPDDRIVADPFFGAAIQGLSHALAESDLQLVLLMARMGGSPERTVRYLRSGHVDGAVIASHHQADDLERTLVDSRLPSVSMGRPWHLPDQLSYVDTDNRLGGELATEHLLGRGRRCIGTGRGSGRHDRRRGPADRLADRDGQGRPAGPGRRVRRFHHRGRRRGDAPAAGRRARSGRGLRRPPT